jgi:hypothetical protein
MLDLGIACAKVGRLTCSMSALPSTYNVNTVPAIRFAFYGRMITKQSETLF